MVTFVLRRVLVAIPIVLLSSVLVFILVSQSGDPLAYLRTNPNIPESTIAQRAHDLYLDQPLTAQYWHWITGVVRGDLGQSIGGLDVKAELFRRAGITFRMVFVAILLAVVLAVIAGVISAVRQYSKLDYVLTFVGFVFLSLPVFWFAALLKQFIAIDINRLAGRTVLYTVGDSTPGLTGSFWDNLPNYLGHLLLPTIALAAVSYAAWSRYQRTAMLDVLNSDYVRMARAKGLSRRHVMVHHALRTALIPLTTIVALDAGAVLGGAVITETVFGWHGLGEMLISGIQAQDSNVILAWLMFSALFVIALNLLADILYALLDPRIRYA